MCTNSKVSTYGDYRVDGVDAGPEFTYDLKSKMFFPRNYYRTKARCLYLDNAINNSYRSKIYGSVNVQCVEHHEEI